MHKQLIMLIPIKALNSHLQFLVVLELIQIREHIVRKEKYVTKDLIKIPLSFATRKPVAKH